MKMCGVRDFKLVFAKFREVFAFYETFCSFSREILCLFLKKCYVSMERTLTQNRKVEIKGPIKKRVLGISALATTH